MHGLESNPAVLRRWEALQPGKPLPNDWNAFRRTNTVEAVQIAARDPELVALLDGTASAGLRADAITGKLDSTPPAVGQVDAEARNRRVQEILAAKPWGDGKDRAPNISLQMELRHLAPQVADMAAATHAQEHPPMTTRQRFEHEQQAAQRIAQQRYQSMLLAHRLTTQQSGW